MKAKLELISALIDDECNTLEREAAILQLMHDKKAQRLWASSYISRELLQDAGSSIPSAGFAARVSQALSQEPIVLVGQQRPPTQTPIKPAAKNPNNIIKLIFKPVAGVAVAATVAATALIIVDNQDIGTTELAKVQLPEQTAIPAIANNITRVDYAPPSLAPAQQITWKGSAGVSQELNNMLINHSQYANTGGYQSLVPYVRIVGYDEK